MTCDYLYLTGYGKDCIPMKKSKLLLSNPIDKILEPLTVSSALVAMLVEITTQA